MSLHGLSKAYGGRVIVDGLSLDIPRGQVLGLIGRSGAGKSTLLRMASLLEKPDSGEVRFRGEPVSGLGGEELLRRRRRVGVVFQAFNLFSSRTAGGNVAFPLEAARRSKAFVRERVPELLGLVGLADKADRPVSRLSGGERQRVAIARAIVRRPRLLLCDEPTGSLDAAHASDVLELLLGAARERAGALLLVTHDRYFLDRVVERTLELENGRLHSYDGGWDRYLEMKAERLAHEERVEANRKNFLRTELDWLRRSPAARTTKQKARVERANAALSERNP